MIVIAVLVYLSVAFLYSIARFVRGKESTAATPAVTAAR